MIVGSLGPKLVFYTSSEAIKTFNDLSISRKARIAKHEILLKRPKLEFQGVDLTTVSLTVYLSANLNIDVQREINQMYDVFDNGFVNTVIIGKSVISDFMIDSLDISNTQHDSLGNISACTISLGLIEYEYD